MCECTEAAARPALARRDEYSSEIIQTNATNMTVMNRVPIWPSESSSQYSRDVPRNARSKTALIELR